MPNQPPDDRARAMLAALGLLAVSMGVVSDASAALTVKQKITTEYTRHKGGSGHARRRHHRATPDITVNKAKVSSKPPPSGSPQ